MAIPMSVLVRHCRFGVSRYADRYGVAFVALLAPALLTAADQQRREANRPVRIAAAQPKNRTVDWKIDDPAEVLRRVDRSLDELEALIHKAGEAGCDALALPEDTLGLLKWEVAHRKSLDKVLPTAVDRMLDHLGRAAAAKRCTSWFVATRCRRTAPRTTRRFFSAATAKKSAGIRR